MGSQVKAICQCGFKKEMMFGAGMLTYKTTEYFPCYCKNCNDMVQGNLKSKKKRCPNCNSNKITFYKKRFIGKNRLVGKKGKTVVARSFNNILTDGLYLCPKCQEMTLQFFQGGILWD